MCKYACGAKYNMLYYKDRWYATSRYQLRVYAVLKKEWAKLKKLKGDKYKKARRAYEPLR